MLIKRVGTDLMNAFKLHGQFSSIIHLFPQTLLQSFIDYKSVTHCAQYLSLGIYSYKMCVDAESNFKFVIQSIHSSYLANFVKQFTCSLRTIMQCIIAHKLVIHCAKYLSLGSDKSEKLRRSLIKRACSDSINAFK